MNVTIIGAGNMGKGIGARLIAGGHRLTILDRDEAKARDLANELGAEAGVLDSKVKDEVVVLALPYPAEKEIAEKYKDALSGKVIVEISNPVDFGSMQFLTPPDRSAAEELGELLPSSQVVKAFNTTFASTLVEGKVAEQPLDVFIAGDDQSAKDKVSALISDGGLRPIDIGELKRAKLLESLQLVQFLSQKAVDGNFDTTVKILK